jgi:hypothetical protein
MLDSEFLPAIIKNIPLIFTLLGAFTSLILINCFSVNKNYLFEQKMSSTFRFIYVFLNKKWHFDQIANEFIAVKMMNFGYSSTFKTLDKGLIEQFGPTGIASSIFNISFNIIAFQSGYLYHTIFFFVYCFGLYFFIYFIMSLGFVVSIFNTQFFLLIFAFSTLMLSKTAEY